MPKSLNDVTPDDLTEISKLAALFFTPREVAIMQELDIDAFIVWCDKDDNAVYKAYHSGRLQAEVDLRTGIMKLAKSGSSPAQTMALDMLNKSKIKMLDR